MHTGKKNTEKLRLSSKKHYERDKYTKRSLASLACSSGLWLSIPPSCFTEASLSSLDMLHSRVVSKMGTVTQGVHFVAHSMHVVLFRLDRYIIGRT